MLRREIAAEKKTPIPCRRKRKREVLRFSWAPCEKLRGLREVAEALGCGATWTSLDDGRRGLLKAVRKLRASSETVERPPEGIRIAYLPDPVKSQGAPPERYAPPPSWKVWCERSVAEVCCVDAGRRHPRAADGRCVRRAAHSRRVCAEHPDALGKAGGERVRGVCQEWGRLRRHLRGAYLGCKGWLDVLPECSVVDFEHWSALVWKSTRASRPG